MIVAFIHAKATSERLPGKNLLPLGGVPLFVHAVRAALNAESISDVLVDSESEEILTIGKRHGAKPLLRPVEMATNETTGDDLAHWQASNVSWSTAIVQVVPTSPFIRPETIDRAVDQLRLQGVDSVVGVRSERLYLWYDGRPIYRQNGRLPNSQDVPATTWETTGLYVVKTSYVLARRQRINPDSCYPMELSQVEAVDINTAEDYEFAKIVWAGMEKRAC
jgi:CMP-N-acetylneuraminic acid synthetase